MKIKNINLRIYFLKNQEFKKVRVDLIQGRSQEFFLPWAIK